MTMACTLLKTSLIFLVIHQMRRTAATNAASLSTSYVSSLNTTVSASSTINNITNTESKVSRLQITPMQRTATSLVTQTINTSNQTQTPSDEPTTTISTPPTKTLTSGSVTIKPSSPSRTRSNPSSTGGGKTKNTSEKNDSEPKASLYIWEIVACGAGAFVFLLFIIIGILCYQNKTLRKRVKAVGNYSLPIKENGVWIDNQDIPLWQKRASIYNAQGNPAEDNSAQDNPAVEESEAT